MNGKPCCGCSSSQTMVDRPKFDGKPKITKGYVNSKSGFVRRDKRTIRKNKFLT